MTDPSVTNVWTWRGRVGRARYFATGLILLGLKHNLDRMLAVIAGYPWSIFNYWIFDAPVLIRLYPERELERISVFTAKDLAFYLVLLLFALPFIWIGTVLTLRRLRDAGLPLWLVMLFFVPFLNLIFFIILSVIPSWQLVDDDRPKLTSRIGRLIPQSSFGSAVFGIVVTAILALIETLISTDGLGQYGWGLFVGIPFFLGLNSTMIYGFHEPRSLGRCLLVSTVSVGLVGVALLGFAVEGIVCLVMALPLAIVFALFGGLIGYVLQKRLTFSTSKLRVASAVFLLMPGLILLEYGFGRTPPLYESKTSVVIKSDPETVWKQLVVTSAQLPPPTEAIFKTGLAYPIHAEMWGHGVGAERHSTFSTGVLVQSITRWDEPRLLAFDITKQPPSMEETSIYNNVRPPHLENYFVARRGQFELKALPDGTTLLEGTTWYQNYYWPASYWHLWSDYIVDGVHMRVLLRIKSLAENESQKTNN
jgi:uncharacterized membrane protein YhaH (DUF805 family)